MRQGSVAAGVVLGHTTIAGDVPVKVTGYKAAISNE
jgi:hypothetical protein